MTRADFLELLRRCGRCDEAAKWIHSKKGKTPEQLWNIVQNVSWMFWLLSSKELHPYWMRAYDAYMNYPLHVAGPDRVRYTVTWADIEPALVAELNQKKALEKNLAEALFRGPQTRPVHFDSIRPRKRV